MPKNQNIFICQNCSFQTKKWMGKCPECNEWNTFEEERLETNRSMKVGRIAVKGRDIEIAKPINQIEGVRFERTKTGINEFDRVVGGGLVDGSLTLIGGQPGIGKSTLLMEVCGKLAKLYPNEKILYVSGEESSSQIAQRCKRLGIESENILLANTSSLQNVKEQLRKCRPKFFVLDSVQTTISEEIQSPPGTISQIREVCYEVMNHSKAFNVTSFVIGHVTKEGSIAGPKILEHMVDTVIYFEGDQLGHYRLLRVMKNRFGNTNEVGIFEMNEDGLQEVKNPSQCFLDEPLENSFGRSLTCIFEGTRPLLMEIQALVVENKFSNPRKTTQGIDNNRLSMLIAVIEKYFNLPIGMNDIYVNVVGGVKLTSRESDLSIIASLLSSLRNCALEEGIVFVGEVGLTGEVRTVPNMEPRLKELAQLNYKKIITSYGCAKKYQNKFNIEIIGIKKAEDLQTVLF